MVEFKQKQLFLFFGALLFFGVLAGAAFFWFQSRQVHLQQEQAVKQGQDIIEQEVGPNQFPLTKEDDVYHFLCASGNVVTQEPVIELPTGQHISHTLPCRYNDATGQEQVVHLPLYTYHLTEKTGKTLGYKVKHDVPKHMVSSAKQGWTEHSAGMIDWLKRAGWTGPGHIFYLSFALPTVDDDLSYLSSGGYFNQVLQELFSPQVVEQFVQTGETSLFPKTTTGEPLILPVEVSFNSRFAGMQQESNE